jgi:curved DNA-binding protein CbpA
MPKRDLYRILGIPTRVAPGEIKRAYRRIAFEFHPDVGKRPDPERFREAHEAYEILNDPNQRRSYDVKLGSGRQSQTAEPLRSKAPVTIIDDFLTLRPSIDELLDHDGLNFFGYPRKGGRLSRVISPRVGGLGCWGNSPRHSFSIRISGQ